MKKQTKLLLAMFSLVVVATLLTNSIVSATTVPTKSELIIAQRGSLTSDQQQITKAVILDNQPTPPQAPVKVNKIAIAGSFALASVLIGEHGGGMAALAKKQNNWQVIGGGGGWMVLNDLVKLGIPHRSAEILLGQIDPNWRNYEPQ